MTTVASTATGVPFSFIDPRTNKLTGAMVDLMQAVTKAAGLATRSEALPFAALLPSLRARRIDLIAAAMFKTPSREEIVAFTDPVYAYGGGVVVAAADLHPTTRLADLRGRKVGAQVGSAFVDELREAGVENVVTYDNLSDMLRDLGHGRIEAAYGDDPILAYQLQVYPRAKLRRVSEFRPPQPRDICFILRKDDPMLARLNRAIADVKTTELDAILRRWRLPKTV